MILTRQTRPYLATGWFWFLVTLVPVIGLVQVGEQSHADRYMYIPMVGLSLMVAWGGADAARKWPSLRPVVAAGGVLICVTCGALAWRQTAVWRNAETLYGQAISATGENWLAEGNLGAYLLDQPERGADAVRHLEASLRLKPGYPEAGNNLGVFLLRAGACPAAIPYFQAAFRAKPNLAAAADNLGGCMMMEQRYADAIPFFEAALRAQPGYYGARVHLAMGLSKIPGRNREAAAHYRELLRIRPDDQEARRNLQALITQAPSNP